MENSQRSDAVERRNRVLECAIAYMETQGGFPSGRSVYNMFLENQYPGNPNAINNDLKSISKDIATVYLSKQTTEIGGLQFDIPAEALTFAVQAFQSIEVSARDKYDHWMMDQEVKMKEMRSETSDLKSDNATINTELMSKIGLLDMMSKQIGDLKSQLELRDTALNKANQEINDLRQENGRLSAIEVQVEKDKLSYKESIEQLKVEQKENIERVRLDHASELKLQVIRDKEQTQKLILKYEQEIRLEKEEFERVNELCKKHEYNLAQLKDDNEAVQREIYELKPQLNHADIVIIDLKAKVNDFELEIDDKNEKFDQQMNGLSEQVIALTEEKVSLKATNTAIRDEREYQDSKVNELKKEIGNMSEQIHSLEKQLTELPILHQKK